jgi:hypothetical protein
MADPLQDSAILEQERLPIELLARETHTTIAKVQEVFLEEYKKLAQGARIMAFVPLLAGNLVRKRLTDQNASRAEASKPRS